MTETRTLKQLAAKVRISCTYGAKATPEDDDDWRQSAIGWSCTLRYQGRQYTFDFWQGSAIREDPDAHGCLDCLLSDAQAGEQDFEEFCSETGYDSDSRKAEATWKACQKTAKAMRRLLGDDFETFLYADRND